MKIIKKSKKIIDNKIIQKELKDRLIVIINKSIKNNIFQISYKEYINEGMTNITFFEIINELTKNNWKIIINEFDFEIF